MFFQFVIATLSIPLLTGGDLLDHMPSGEYWKSRDVVVSVENILAELPTNDAKLLPEKEGKDVAGRRLMAIRTLGELKNRKALPMLRKLLHSKRPFEVRYTQRAIASIEGKPWVHSQRPGQAELDKDALYLAHYCDLVFQIAPTEPIPAQPEQARSRGKKRNRAARCSTGRRRPHPSWCHARGPSLFSTCREKGACR